MILKAKLILAYLLILSYSKSLYCKSLPTQKSSKDSKKGRYLSQR